MRNHVLRFSWYATFLTRLRVSDLLQNQVPAGSEVRMVLCRQMLDVLMIKSALYSAVSDYKVFQYKNKEIRQRLHWRVTEEEDYNLSGEICVGYIRANSTKSSAL